VVHPLISPHHHENLKPSTMKIYLSTPDIEKAYKELKSNDSPI
jgi:hypothetical protein